MKYQLQYPVIVYSSALRYMLMQHGNIPKLT